MEGKKGAVARKGNGSAAVSQRSGKIMGAMRFETLNAELFFSTLIASIVENFAGRMLPFSLNEGLFFALSFVANIFLIEFAFRVIKATKKLKN